MKRISFNLLLIVFVFGIILFSIKFCENLVNTSIVLATDSNNNQMQSESINPDLSLRYKFKRLSEKTNLLLIGLFKSKQKVTYLIQLTNKRLSEFKYIIENSKMTQLEESSSRYVTFIGLLTNELNNKPGYAGIIKNGIDSHPEILIQLRDKFSSETAEWRFVQQCLESAQVLLSKT